VTQALSFPEQSEMEELPMKQFKTALLASAFALASTLAFAQAGVGASGNAGTGANMGASSGSTQLNSGANVKASGNKANVDVNASDSTTIKKNKNQTTGSGAAGVNGTVNTK
jgi:hypothetical protein